MSKKINNLARQRDYQEKYKRKFPYRWFKYCREPLEDIEGWNEMLNDTSGQTWHLHHRDEISEDGEVVSRDELKSRGEYYNIPANKLIFLTEFGHKSIHSSTLTGELCPNYGRNKYGIKKEELYELYVVQKLTQQEIADKIGCYRRTISWYLKKFGIKKQDV